VTRRLSLTLLGSALLLAGSVPVLAQSHPQVPPSGAASAATAQQGPLRLQRIRSGMVFAPEVKIADIDDVTGTFVGGYAGWLSDERFLVGGGGYWLVSPTDHRDVGYFGGIVGWQVPLNDAVRVGARGLVGGGWATLLGAYDFRVPDHPWGRPPHPTPIDWDHAGDTVQGWAYVGEEFFVFEPQLDLSVRVADSVSLTTGISYRVVAGAGDFDDRLRGVAGNIAIQVGVY